MTDISSSQAETAAPAARQPSKECDLVMKGGITSGVIYPKAVLALSQEYRFRSIGGTSAGAIAAAATAAAEYGRDAPVGGFAKLEGMVDQLTQPWFIYNLFQPSAKAWPLLAGLLSYRQRRGPVGAGTQRPDRASLAGTLPRVLWTMFTSSPSGPLWSAALLGALAGLLVAALLVAAALVAAHPLAVTVLVVLALLAIPLGWVIGIGVGIQQLVVQHIPCENFYGLCTGMPVDGHNRRSAHPATTGMPPALTAWLADTIDDLAGLPLAPAADRRDVVYATLDALAGKRVPLTFRHLALNHQEQVTQEHKIVLNMVTANLSQGLPYTLPFTNGPFLFSEQEFRALFPDYVVDYMIAVSNANPPADIAQQPIRATVPRGEDHNRALAPGDVYETHDLYFLPRGLDLPVIVGARMSLSFPLLISAIPLWTIKAERLGARPAGGERLALQETDLQRNWFSDGGTCSNFPIHFYDRWFPGRPTFGINLESLPEDFFTAEPGEPTLLNPTIAEYRSIIRTERWPEQSAQPTPPILAQERAPDDTWRVFDHVPAANTNRELAQMPTAGEADRPLPPWQSMHGSVAGFLLSIVNTGLFYRDTLLARLPSYYDRIATVYLSEQEGGLNLDMPERVIADIAERGHAAGTQMRHFSFDQHRWVRLRLLLAEMEEQIGRLRGSILPPPGTPSNGGDICPAQPTGNTMLDWSNPDVQAALAALGSALNRAGLNANAVRQLLLCQHARPEAFPYPAPADWSDGDDDLSSRFLLLQLLIEMWTQQKGVAATAGAYPALLRDAQAPPRDGMSMRVAPDL
jgi:Patatin-like phospholipase